MKKITLLNLFLFISIILFAQSGELLFFDDFEQDEVNPGTEFKNWTSENISGNSVWHIIPSSERNKSQCLRFETDKETNDNWIISKQITGDNIQSITLTFRHHYYGNKIKPKLKYTNQYNGNAQQSNWTELEYQLAEQENKWSGSGDVIINDPGDKLYFAFHIQSNADSSIFFLIDNFNIDATTSRYEEIASSDHFEFYSSIESNEDFTSILSNLETQLSKLTTFWNLPGGYPVFGSNSTTQIYYCDKEEIPEHIYDGAYDWRCGFYDWPRNRIYLSPLNSEVKLDYYKNFNNLALQTFSAYTCKKRIQRSNILDTDDLPDYLREGFGLYEIGYRPNRDSIISYLATHPGQLNEETLVDISGITNTSVKDMVVSIVEAQILFGGFFEIKPDEYYMRTFWDKYLTHFYDTTDVVQIKNYASDEYFDIYCSSRDTMYIDSLFMWLNNTREFYVDSFQTPCANRYPLVIIYDQPTATDLTGQDRESGFGGSGALNISPNEWGVEDYDWLLAHEYGHVYNSAMSNFFPTGFFQEGMANFSGYNVTGADWSGSRPNIEHVLYYYSQKYNREPTLDEFITDPHRSEPDFGGIDPYFFGFEFIRYLHQKNSLPIIRDFFVSNLDFTVFSESKSEIEKGYINYLKSLIFLAPPESIQSIPFEESFDDFINGWTKPNFSNQDNWQIDDGGINGSKCARFYTNSDKNEPIESWLITPAFSATDFGKVVFSFDYSFYGGENIDLEMFYTSNFDGDVEESDWSSLGKVASVDDHVWGNSTEITITNPSDTLFIGIRYKASGLQHQQANIDNFKVKDRLTSSKINTMPENNFKVYPNPGNKESIVTFINATSGRINLSLFDMHGRKISTILDKKLQQGKHTIPIWKYMPGNGIYFCRLSTDNGISTIKLVINKQ